MKFTDFKPEELVGKLVLYSSGKSYNNRLNQAIRTIERITTTGFRISKHESIVFNFNGDQKGLNSRADIGTISRCELITEEKAKELVAQWNQNKLISKMKTEIKDKLDSLSFEQLEKITKIINPQP